MKSLFVLPVILASAWAAAQAMDPFDYAVSNIAILQAKPLQKELGLSEVQRAAMNKFADQFNASMGSLLEKAKKDKSGKPPSDADPKVKAAYEELKKGVLKQLTPSQLKRLREVTLQQSGLPALADPVVAKRVGLSATQLKTIQTTFETAIRKAAEIQDKAIEAAVKDLKAKKPKTEKEAKDLMDEANNRAEAAHRKVEPQITKLRKDAEAKVLATLTAQQKAAWEALKGKKFTPPAGS
jgi:hypothetical protein